MITKEEFKQRVIRKISQYRSIAGCIVCFDLISNENEVIESSMVNERFVLRGCSGDQSDYIIHTHKDFIGSTYDEIMSRFILVMPPRSFEREIYEWSQHKNRPI